MLNCLLTLRTEGPVFVGDGKMIGKKEYIFLPEQQKVCVPDMTRMFQDFEKRRLLDAYQTYLLQDRRDFTRWLRDYRLLIPLPSWIAYAVDSADAVFEERGKREIAAFMKDPYGQPYIPGSSVKGMLRTVLLNALILRDHANLYAEIQSVRRAELRGPRIRLLEQETNRLEQRFLHTLQHPETAVSNKVNDMMCGLRVSDSRPLSTKDLILCQKIDVTTDGQRKRLPVLRECLRPGTEIFFDLTLLPDKFPFSEKELLQAAECCQNAYKKCFLSAFPTHDIRQGGTVYLGGGCGYATKTFTYPLLQESGIETVSRIIDATLPAPVRRQHKHQQDLQKGVSPHMLKCTQYHREIYEMGACSMAIKEKL